MDRIIEQKKGIRKKHLPYIAIGIFFLSVIGWIIFGDHNSKMNISRDRIITATAEYGVFNNYLSLSGQVKPKNQIFLSALESGIIEKCLVAEGDTVKKGDILLVLNNPELLQQTRETETQYLEKLSNNKDAEINMEKERLSMQQQRFNAKIETNRAQRNYEQQKALYDDGLATHEEFLKAKENHELAESNLLLLEQRLKQDSLYRKVQIQKMTHSLNYMFENLQQAHRRAENLKIKATHDGQLSSFNLQLGQNVSAGTNVGIINILDEFKLQVNVDERYTEHILPGLSGKIERNKKHYPVEISTIYPDIHNGQFRIDLVFTDSVPDNIRVGQTFYLNLEIGAAVDAVLIPRGAFFASTGGKWIYKLTPDEKKAVRQSIKIGRQNPDSYEIIEGLQPGDKVIISNYDAYGDSESLILE